MDVYVPPDLFFRLVSGQRLLRLHLHGRGDPPDVRPGDTLDSKMLLRALAWRLRRRGLPRARGVLRARGGVRVVEAGKGLAKVVHDQRRGRR